MSTDENTLGMSEPGFVARMKDAWSKRGAFEQTPSPRSVSLLRRTYERQEGDVDSRAQDDSVVYSESKSSRHGAKLRPQRRGESFSIRSTSKRPTSWHPVNDSTKADVILRTQQKGPVSAETPKRYRPKSPSDAKLTSASSMQFGLQNSKSALSTASFQSLQNLGSAGKSASRLSGPGAEGPVHSHMANSASWHGAGSASQPSLNKSHTQPPPVEPRRKLHSNSGYVNSVTSPGAGVEPYPGSRSRFGCFPTTEDNTGGMGFLSYSQSHVQLHTQSDYNGPPTAGSVSMAHSMHDIRQRHDPNKDYNSYGGWSRPTPYKPNNYENIDAFEAAKCNAAAAASLSHGSRAQAEAYSHSYTNFAQSRTISEDGFIPRTENGTRCDVPPEIPPWPQPDHRQMLSEDSGVELSMTSPPPPLPGRDDSRGHYYLNPSRSMERISSWPTTYPAQGEEEEKGKVPRIHSWSAYQPRLNAHLEENQDNKQGNYPQRAVISNGESVERTVGYGALDAKGEVEIKNLYNAKPMYPCYGYETNFDVFNATNDPNPKVESTPIDDLFQYTNQTKDLNVGQSSPPRLSLSSPPPLPQSAPPLPKNAPPLPQTAPPLPQSAPPSMPQKARTSSSSSGHTIIVRQKPFYNTATQTEISTQTKPPSAYLSGPPPASPRMGQTTQPIPVEPTYRNVEIQVNMDLVMVTPMVTPMSTLERRKLKKADQGCQVQPSMLPDMLHNNSSGSIKSPLVQQENFSPSDNYTDINSFHRPAPLVEKMTQEKRIPETIREESPKKYENANTAQDMCSPTQAVKDSILQSINDHSPSQTSIMRKLSREFFGNQMKNNYSSHPSLLTVPEVQPQNMQRRRSGEPHLLRQSKEYWSPGDTENNKTVDNKPPPCAEPKDGSGAKENKKKMDRSKKLSLRKAFGIFDEIDTADDPNKRFLSNQGKCVSASHVGSSRNNKIHQESKQLVQSGNTDKPARWYNRAKGDEVHKDALHQRYDSGHFSQEETNSSKITQKLALPITDSHVKKLHRTSSEQIRPVKERIADRERILEASTISKSDIRRQKASEQIRHKTSDPLEYHEKESGAVGHRSSDPSMEEYRRSLEKTQVNQHRLSDPASSQNDKRLSGDSDVFRGPFEQASLQRRTTSVRSTSSSSLDGHRISDPELKKMQHMAVLNFFEMKTGKRLSSSSMDSSGNSKYNSLSSRGSSSVDSAVGLYRERSPSPQKIPDECNLETRLNAIKKSKSLPRDIAGQVEDGCTSLSLTLPPQSADKPHSAVSSWSASAREPFMDRGRSAPTGRLIHHKKEKSAPSQMESYQVLPVEIASTDQPQQVVSQLPVDKPDSQLSPVGASSSPDCPDTNAALDCGIPLPKQTYEYSSSSSGSSSPIKSPATSEFGQKYHSTANKGYLDNNGSPPPPVLPPRNYRPSPTNSEHKFRPPPTPPPCTTMAVAATSPPATLGFGNDVVTDANTPQPDIYAQQLRQQMRRQFSAHNAIGVGAARLQSKVTIPEVKQGVAMSRPVDRPLMPQEAVTPPQPLPRSATVPEINLPIDGHGYPDGTKSAREATSTSLLSSLSSSHKMDIHMSSGHVSSHQQQSQPTHQIHHHYQHHNQQQPHHHQQQQQHHQQQQHIHSQHSQQPNNNNGNNCHQHASQMQQSHSLTNINVRTLDAAPVAAPRDQHNNRLPISDQRQLPPPLDHNRNSPKDHPKVTKPSPKAPPPPKNPPPIDEDEDDDDETLEKQPFSLPESSPVSHLEDDAQKLLSFDDDADVGPQKYSNESYMTKKTNSRQGFNGNYRRSNSNEILKTSTSSTLSQPTGPLSPSSTNPPKTETVVKAPTVVTVNKTIGTPESKARFVEAGPLRTPASNVASGSKHQGTPPPVPPKYHLRNTGHSLIGASTPPTDRLHASTDDLSGSQGSLEAPVEFILSGRPGVTNLDEASSLLNKLNSMRGSNSGSPISNSSGLVGSASGSSKVNTPVNTPDSTSISNSREHLGGFLQKSEENLTSFNRVNGMNGHQSNLSSPEPILTRPRHTLVSRSITDSPPSLPSCPPPALPSKESTSSEPKEECVSKEETKEEPKANVEKQEPASSPVESPVHVRQKSMEEIECEKVAAVVAIQIVDDDKELSDVILPPPEHKMTTDFMLGLFPVDDLPPVPSIAVNRLSPRANKDENKENKRSTVTASSPYGSQNWSPLSVASLQNKMREEGIKREEILREMGMPDTSLQRQKEELQARIEQKLSILRTEKDALREEISNNEFIGKEVTGIVKKKVQNKGEFDKYKLYVDELDKVMYLLLKLSGRLARAENAVMSLSPDADDKEKMLLQMKRDEASEKHADAKTLKQGIDRRSQQVSSFLNRYLTQEELDTYTYYIKMKSKLTMEQQEIDDKIKLGDEQLRALKLSMQR